MKLDLQKMFGLSNDNALAGVEINRNPARIYIDNGQFVYRDSNDEVKLVAVKELRCIIVNSRPVLSRMWYAIPSEADISRPADCSSFDGNIPDEDSAIKQSDFCKDCPSKRLCKRYKMLAVLISGRIYELPIPENSFNQFYDYVQRLNQDRVVLALCNTIITTFGNIYKFRMCSGIDEELHPNIIRFIESSETLMITGTNPSMNMKELPPPVVIEASNKKFHNEIELKL